jgi:hypothetical protein
MADTQKYRPTSPDEIRAQAGATAHLDQIKLREQELKSEAEARAEADARLNQEKAADLRRFAIQQRSDSDRERSDQLAVGLSERAKAIAKPARQNDVRMMPALTPDMIAAAQRGELNPDGSMMKPVDKGGNDWVKQARESVKPPTQQPAKKKGFFAGLFQ